MEQTQTPNILDSFRGLLDDHLGKKEFIDAFKQVLKVIKDLKSSNETEWALIHDSFQLLESKFKKMQDTGLTAVKSVVDKRLNQAISEAKAQIITALREQESGMNFVRDKAAAVQNGIDGAPGLPGKDANEEAIVARVLAQLQPLLAEETTKIRAELQTAPVSSTRAGWGAHPLAIAQSGTVKAKVARHLNFTGATVTQNRDGTTTVAVSASGLSVLAATGTINDSNKVFTFASTPTFVVVNGAIYKTGGGVTIATTTATLDNVIGTGGSIFGLG